MLPLAEQLALDAWVSDHEVLATTIVTVNEPKVAAALLGLSTSRKPPG